MHSNPLLWFRKIPTTYIITAPLNIANVPPVLAYPHPSTVINYLYNVMQIPILCLHFLKINEKNQCYFFVFLLVLLFPNSQTVGFRKFLGTGGPQKKNWGDTEIPFYSLDL